MRKVLSFDSAESAYGAIASHAPNCPSFWSESWDTSIYLIEGVYWVIESSECCKVGSSETGWLLTGEARLTLVSVEPIDLPDDMELNEHCSIFPRIAVGVMC